MQDQQTAKSTARSNKSEQEIDYIGKNVEDVAADIEKCLNQHEANEYRIIKIRRDGKKFYQSDKKTEEKVKPVTIHNRYLQNKVFVLAQLQNEKTPIEEKMPKENNFTKFFISKKFFDKIRKQCEDKAKEEKTELENINEKILKPNMECAAEQHKLIGKAQQKREELKAKSLLEEILQY